MIVVIADDLTGAAEISGLALKYGLRTKLVTRLEGPYQTEVLVVSTDTRSLPESEAIQVTQQVVKRVMEFHPTWIFKKLDSVLRGHVLAEIYEQMACMSVNRALIVSSNPGLGRTIEGGIYLLHGKPVHLSNFSHDPEFPLISSRVSDMLGKEGKNVAVLEPQVSLPERGVIVGAVKNKEELDIWSTKIDSQMVIAGAAEFFTAILESFGYQPSGQVGAYHAPGKPALVISGSSFQKRNVFENASFQNGFTISYLEDDFIQGEQEVIEDYPWYREALAHLKSYGKAVLAFGESVGSDPANALLLKGKMAHAVAYLFDHSSINECLIEGGATAAAIISRLHIGTLYPVEELAPGVIRMRAKEFEHLYITLKPGSYEWPESILHL